MLVLLTVTAKRSLLSRQPLISEGQVEPCWDLDSKGSTVHKVSHERPKVIFDSQVLTGTDSTVLQRVAKQSVRVNFEEEAISKLNWIPILQGLLADYSRICDIAC